MQRVYYWLSSSAANNVSQILVAIAAWVAVVYGIIGYEENKIKSKIDIANNSIDKMTESIDDNTAMYVKIIKPHSDNNEIIRNIIRSEPFNYGSVIANITDDKGNVDASTSNRIRFGIVKFLNAWEGMSIIYMNNLGDCDILYRNRIGSIFKERESIKSMRNFIELFEDVNTIKGVSWNNFVSLHESIKSFCLGHDTQISCVQKVKRSECSSGAL